MTWPYRRFGPMKADHPIVSDRYPCAVCGVPFHADDYGTFAFTQPAGPENQAKADAGGAYTAEAQLVHWDHRECAYP